MSTIQEHLYSKIPSVYRIRDARAGYPLRALVYAWAEQVERLEQDIGSLYNNLFIETCEDWAVPYIATLVDAQILPAISASTLSARAQVANTLRLRRRKGTLAMIEETAAGATEWTAHANEYFRRLQRSPFLNHLSPQRTMTPDVRSPIVAERIETPFDTTDRTIEVRRIGSGRGRYNLRNIGIHLWRLKADRLIQCEAQRVPNKGGRFHLHPRFIDFPLFHVPHSEGDVTRISGPLHVPEPLIRWAVFHDLDAFHRAFMRGDPARSNYFDPENQTPSIAIEINGVAIDPRHIMIADLADWEWRPPASRSFPDGQGGESDLDVRIAIDPERGRLSIPKGRRADTVRVTHAQGLPAELGGGAYDRSESVESWLGHRSVDWQVGVSRMHDPVADTIVATVEEALALWDAQPPGTTGVILLMDNSTWSPPDAAGWTISVPEGSRLLMTSGSWSEQTDSLGNPVARRAGDFTAREVRGVLMAEPGDTLLSITGNADLESQTPGEMMLNGLFLAGAVTIEANRIGKIATAHCRADPAGQNTLVSTDGVAHPEFAWTITRSRLGSVSGTLRSCRVEATDCIFDGQGNAALQLPEAILDLTACTCLGAVACSVIHATDCLFVDPVVAARRQLGCIRFSWLPLNQKTPRRYKCQPDLAWQAAQGAAAKQHALRRVSPVFASRNWASPWYAMLSPQCPVEITCGSESRDEMGAYALRVQHLREKALALALEDALPVGLEAGHFYQT